MNKPTSQLNQLLNGSHFLNEVMDKIKSTESLLVDIIETANRNTTFSTTNGDFLYFRLGEQLEQLREIYGLVERVKNITTPFKGCN